MNQRRLDRREEEDSLVPLLVPERSLQDWVGSRLPGSGLFRIERATTGHSNELFLIEREGGTWLLRRPPRVPHSPTAHDMSREFQVLTALEGTNVPHPRPVLFCDDVDVIGAPFLVMERVKGIRMRHHLPKAFRSASSKIGIADAIIDGLLALHSVDWRRRGLENFGRPDGYLVRQVPRWMSQLDRYRCRDLPDLDCAASWLERNVPTMQTTSLIHGDYGMHNVLYHPAPPPRLAAILDWETSTIGDPLVDLGYLLGYWLEEGEQDEWYGVTVAHNLRGLPSRRHLANRYAERTNLALDALTWYRTLGQFKIAIILEGSYARYLRGEGDDPYYETLEDIVPNLAAHAVAIMHGRA